MDEVALDDGVVRLRAWRPDDADAVLRACQDPQTQRWTSVPVPYLAEHAEAFVEASPAGWAADRPTFAAVDSVDDHLLGSFGVVDRSADGDPEIGYWVAPWARRRGTAVRATRQLCRWLLLDVGEARVTWRAEVGNTASRRVAEKVGFVMEGTARQALVHRGHRVDAWVGSLLPKDLGRASASPPRSSLVDGWPVSPVTLRTDRLVLRPYVDADAPHLLEASADPDFELWNPQEVVDLADALDRVRTRADWSDGQRASWAVADPADDRLLGGVLLHSVDAANGVAELGYGLAAAARGRGYAAEAVDAVSRWVFSSLAVHRLEIVHAVENDASCGVATRAGFALEGVLRQSYRYGDGQLHDEHLHARLATDPAAAG